MVCGTTSKISIVIPVYNEEENIQIIADELSRVLADCNNYEIIFVDDGSKDKTLEKIKQVCRSDKRVFFLSFSRNFGHQNALRAGLDCSTGDAVVTMDGDLQHPPEVIPEMIAKWKEGFDIVFTTRRDSQETPALKRNTAKWYYRIINRIADIDLKRGAADFRLMDRKVVDSLKRFDEKAIFYRGLVAWLGFRQYELVYDPLQRMFGETKYSFRKMLRLAVDGITSFSLFPLRAAAVIGMIMAVFSFIYVVYALYIKFFTASAVSGWVSIMAGIYFLGGIQLIFLGLCGEYIGRIFMEVKKRPNYIVAESNLPEQKRNNEV